MDLTNTNISRTEALQDKVNLERDFVDISELALKMTEILKTHVTTHAEVETLDNFSESVNVIAGNRRETLARNQATLEQSKIIKAIRKDKLQIPPDRPTGVRVETKEVKDIVGVLNDENKVNIKGWFMKLFAYGEAEQFNHENYKLVLSSCLEGSLLTEYILMENREFKEIAQYFYRTCHTPLSLSQYQKILSNFKRRENEPIEVYMERYSLPASKADEMVPENERQYTTLLNRMEVLKQALCEPARSAFVRWNAGRRDECMEGDFKSILEQAKMFEITHQAIPTTELAVNLAGASMDLNELEIPYGIDDETEDLIEANPALLRRISDRYNGENPKFSSREIRNAKSLLKPRSDRHKSILRDPYAARRPDFKSENLDKEYEQPQGNAYRHPGPYINKKIVNFPDEQGREIMSNREKQKSNYENQLRERLQKEYQNSQNQQNYKKQYYDRKLYNNKYSNKSQNNENKRFAYGKYLDSQKEIYPQRESSYNQKRGNRYKAIPEEYSRQTSENHENKYTPGPRIPKSLGKPVRPGVYCVRCGVPRYREQQKGTDHMSNACPYYQKYNEHDCDYCWHNKHVKAKHFASDCLQNPNRE